MHTCVCPILPEMELSEPYKLHLNIHFRISEIYTDVIKKLLGGQGGTDPAGSVGRRVRISVLTQRQT